MFDFDVITGPGPLAALAAKQPRSQAAKAAQLPVASDGPRPLPQAGEGPEPGRSAPPQPHLE